MYKLFIFLVFSPLFLFSQIRYTTICNSSTMTSSPTYFQITSQSKNNVYVAFKRGVGTSLADREIRIARSTDAGLSFTESNITIPDNSETYDPLIASTQNSILCLYIYKTGNDLQTCIARSTNNGGSFSLTANNSSTLRNALFLPHHSSTFISDGLSKYLIGRGSYMVISTDNGNTFTEKNLPFTVDYSRFAITPNYIWAVFNKTSGDSIFVYRSSNNGTTFQFICKFYNDFPGNYDLNCTAADNQLFIGFVHEEVGTYYLRMRTVTDNSLGSIIDINTTSTNPLGIPFIRKTDNCLYFGMDNNIYKSSDNGNSWTRASNSFTEFYGYHQFGMFAAIDDTTLYLHSSRTQSGSIKQVLFSNWMWTDKPIPELTSDSLLLTRNISIYFKNYISTQNNQLQISKFTDFSSLELDTLQNYRFYFDAFNRLEPNGTIHYYRIRGSDLNYNTSWSTTKYFRYGSTLPAPTIATPDGAHFSYPNMFSLQINNPITNRVYGHYSTNSSFTDTLQYGFGIFDSHILSFFPWMNNQIINGVFYYRFKYLEESTGSTSPWSEYRNFVYSGAPTSVELENADIPKNFELYANYPNPFNPETKISFDLPKQEDTRLIIYDILGNIVDILVNEQLSPGKYQITWVATNLSSGVYFYKLQAGKFSETKKMILVR
jgi:hypothetical protein